MLSVYVKRFKMKDKVFRSPLFTVQSSLGCNGTFCDCLHAVDKAVPI